MAFDTGVLRLWTGFFNASIDSETYIASGDILQISQIHETSDTKATGVTIGLTGLDSSLLSAGLNDNVQGTTVKLFFGVLTTSSNADAIVDTPYLIFEGFLDTMVLNEGGSSSDLIFTCEHKLIVLEKATDRRYTDVDQKQLHEGDKGCSFVTSLQNKSLAWGAGVQMPQGDS
ncbi:MAG: hypothetical protein Tp1123DCM1511741_3 [Prokaryotic dsDNA virus sp.]|nr:MAG: hypothetical protein Tp1123DCM1511741_3 [Prokaryotic dsDNA virus sp.]